MRGSNGIRRFIPPFWGWLPDNMTIPKLYWDTYSQEQRIHAICEQLHKVCAYADMLGADLDLTDEKVDALEKEFDEFKASGFLDYYQEQLQAWINENMPWIIEQSIKSVYFGLTLDGHFVAYIPESWNDIIFDTGAVWGDEDYGRLILRYDVESPYSVEQP